MTSFPNAAPERPRCPSALASRAHHCWTAWTSEARDLPTANGPLTIMQLVRRCTLCGAEEEV